MLLGVVQGEGAISTKFMPHATGLSNGEWFRLVIVY
jgi:hypothetical protein